jgi:hypothetical protein
MDIFAQNAQKLEPDPNALQCASPDGLSALHHQMGKGLHAKPFAIANGFFLPVFQPIHCKVHNSAIKRAL